MRRLRLRFLRFLHSSSAPCADPCSSSSSSCAELSRQLLQEVECCCDKKVLSDAVRLHGRIRELGVTQDGFLGAAIVRMFIKCGSLENARCVFDGMLDRSMVLWTSMVAGYVNNGDYRRGWDFFFRMQLEGVLPDRVTFVSILNACDSEEGLARGILVHSLVVEKGLEFDVVIGNALVKMYGKCSSLVDAADFFERMPQRDVISWTGMISAFAQYGHCSEAFGYYLRMHLEGVVPNNITFLAVLGACTGLKEGKLVHAHVLEAEWESDIMVGNALVNMFSKCGSLEDARDVFSRMRYWNSTSWNAMIAACSQHGFCSEALELFHKMQGSKEVKIDKISLVSVLRACSEPEALSEGRAIHELIARSGFESDVIVGTAVVGMYTKCGSLVEARQVFDRIQQKNVVSWNTMITAYSREDNSQHDKAVELFRCMLVEGVRPTRTTILNVINAVQNFGVGKQLHGVILESGLYSDLFIGSALVNMYERAGSLSEARRAFDRIILRDVFAWNAIIAVCVEHGMASEGLAYFEKMQLEGTAANRATFLVTLNAFSSPGALKSAKKIHDCLGEAGFEGEINVANALISMYSRCGSLEDSRLMFEKMEERSVVSWTSIIAACAENGSCREAIELFQRMDLEPDRVTLTTVLEACTVLSAQQEGRLVHSRAVERGLETNVFVATALIHMYCKCGNVEQARELFMGVDMPSLVCWNAMLGGYAQNGHTSEAIEIFHDMLVEGVQPDHISFLTVVSACSHAGLVEKGTRYFGWMSNDFGIVPVVEDYGCLIDLLGRAGQLEEAYDFVNKMPFKPSDITWKTLLAACKVQGDVSRAKSAAHRVLEKEPDSAAAYVELSNMCVREP